MLVLLVGFIKCLTIATNDALHPSLAFNITFACTGLEPNACEIAHRLIELAGEEIGSALSLKRTVNVFAKMAPLVSPGEALEIAFAKPTRYFAANREGGSLMMYPKALVKQAENEVLSPEIVDGYDMEILFNSHVPWAFEDRIHDGIHPLQMCFDCILNFNVVVAGQQLLRGLGFLSRLVDNQQHFTETSVFLTTPIVTTSSGNSYFEPVSVYDSMIARGPDWFLPMLNEITTLGPARMTEREYLYNALDIEELKRSAMNLFMLATSAGMHIAPGPRFSILLNSPSQFSTKSLSYLDPVYVHSPNLLMIPTVPFGISYHRSRSMFNMGPGIGPGIVAVMGGLGYATAATPFFYNFDLSTTFGTDEFNPNAP